MEKLFEQLHFQVDCADYVELDRTWNTSLFSQAAKYVPRSRIYFAVSGCGKVECDGKITMIERGNLVLIPPCARIYVSCDDHLNKYWMHFSAQISNNGADIFSMLDEVVSIPLTEENFAFTEKLFQIIRKQYREFKPAGHNDPPFQEQSAKAALILLLEPFFLKLTKFTEETEFFQLLDVMSYLNNNLHRHITLKELGQYSKMHPNYFSALFKKQIGMPPIAYFNQLRLHRALLELRRGTMRINEIAELIGASTPAAFSKMIRQYIGISPREYRQSKDNIRLK